MEIFNQTIRYNLIFTNEKNRDNEIWNMLRAVKLFNVVKDLPNGLDTELNSRTLLFSGGQEQRLMLARMYLKNPQIIILDESTSALDERTENDITKLWKELFKNKTVIIIAHRFSTIMTSDKVAYLENGKIMGYGKHDRLMEECSQYRQLYIEQYGQSAYK